MALTLTELIAEVRSIIGRDNDTVLVTDTRVTRWLNEAQEYIVERCPGTMGLDFNNRSSIDFSTGQVRYDITDITVGDSTNQVPAHIFAVYFLDGNSSYPLRFVHPDKFNDKWPDPTHTDYVVDKPIYWTRVKKQILIQPRCSSTYDAYDMKITGTAYAGDLSASASTSRLDKADDGLLLYATAQGWRVIGNALKARETMLAFTNPNSTEGGWLEQYQDQNDRLDEWDGGWYSDFLTG